MPPLSKRQLDRRDASPRPVQELVQRAMHEGISVDRKMSGAIQIAYYRGFHGGYVMAMHDAKNDELKAVNATRASRLDALPEDD